MSAENTLVMIFNPLDQFGFYPLYLQPSYFEGLWFSAFFLYDSFWTFLYSVLSSSKGFSPLVVAQMVWCLTVAHSALFYPFFFSYFVPMYVVPLLVIGGLMFFILSSMRPVSFVVPLFWDRALLAFVSQAHSLLGNNVGFAHLRYFNHIFIVFLFVAFANVLGMIPFFFTLTSQFAVTFVLAAVLFVGFNLLAIRLHGLNFFNLFIPTGAPAAIRPFLVFIEFISYFARVLSLSIRLFANMTAGHTLMKILAGYVYVMLLALSAWSFAGFIVLSLLFIIVLLEVFIAFLQAYVFVMLLCVYLNDVLAADAH